MSDLIRGFRNEWPILLAFWIGWVAWMWWDGVFFLDAINAGVLAVFWGLAIMWGFVRILLLLGACINRLIDAASAAEFRRRDRRRDRAKALLEPADGR